MMGREPAVLVGVQNRSKRSCGAARCSGGGGCTLEHVAHQHRAAHASGGPAAGWTSYQRHMPTLPMHFTHGGGGIPPAIEAIASCVPLLCCLLPQGALPLPNGLS
jgi:hypothetical protein